MAVVVMPVVAMTMSAAQRNDKATYSYTSEEYFDNDDLYDNKYITTLEKIFLGILYGIMFLCLGTCIYTFINIIL